MTATAENGRSALVNQRNYVELLRHYAVAPLVLFTGAGASRSTDPHMGLGEWDELLRSLVRTHLTSTDLAEYEAELSMQTPWSRAGWIAERLGVGRLRDALHDEIRASGIFQSGDTGLLEKSFVRTTPTLRAVAAFSVCMIGYTVTTRRGATVYYPRVAPNPRVPAILTSNYDPYLEAAASSMFRTVVRKYPLKPVGAVGSSAGVVGQTPVIHVHGYVPPESDQTHKAFVDPVLTPQDYAAAWTNTAGNYTIVPQMHLLRLYSALFIGCSFRDPWINSLLESINADRTEAKRSRSKRRYHYALISSKEFADRGTDWFERLGVRPITWDDPAEIPAALAGLYCHGIEQDIQQHGAIHLRQYEPVAPNRTRPTSHLTMVTEPGGATHLWRNLERSWHNPLDAAPPGRRATV